jgi:transcriptional regulator
MSYMKEAPRDVPLLKGTLDLLILKALSWGALHGYAIASWLEARSSGTLEVDDSALYQALQRLEARGLVEAEWGMTDHHRKARFYRLTPAGRQRYRTEADTWARYTRSVTAILSLSSRNG